MVHRKYGMELVVFVCAVKWVTQSVFNYNSPSAKPHEFRFNVNSVPPHRLPIEEQQNTKIYFKCERWTPNLCWFQSNSLVDSVWNLELFRWMEFHFDSCEPIASGPISEQNHLQLSSSRTYRTNHLDPTKLVYFVRKALKLCFFPFCDRSWRCD